MLEIIRYYSKVYTVPRRPYIVVSYFTVGTGYETESVNLSDSLEKFRISYDIAAIKNLGSWQKNTQVKVDFIYHMLMKHNKPLVFLDADAVVRRDPVLFDSVDCDIAIHYRDKKQLLSGTIYLNPCPRIYKVLGLWKLYNENNPNYFEQDNLKDAIHVMKDLNVYKLPASFCQIFDLMSHEGEPIIEHMQASRRFKKSINDNI